MPCPKALPAVPPPPPCPQVPPALPPRMGFMNPTPRVFPAPPPRPAPPRDIETRSDEDDPPVNLEFRRQAAEELFGEIAWASDVIGHFECPGAHLHTVQSTDQVRVYLEGVPWIECFHQTCGGLVAHAGRKLRGRIKRKEKGKDTSGLTGRTPIDFREWQRQKALEARNNKWMEWFWDVISRPEMPDTFPHWRTTPSDRICDDREDFLHLFHPSDLIWCGEVNESGPKSFVHVATLQKRPQLLRSQFISTCTFEPGSTRRSYDNVLARRFLVVESDELSIPQQTALLMALAKEWPLAAVVSSGNKSLHGWFRWLPEWSADRDALQSLRTRLRVMHCDPAGATATQPFRLPGILNRKSLRFQALIYLNLDLKQAC